MIQQNVTPHYETGKSYAVNLKIYKIKTSYTTNFFPFFGFKQNYTLILYQARANEAYSRLHVFVWCFWRVKINLVAIQLK